MKNYRARIIIVTISDLLYEANLHRKAHTLAKAGFKVTVFASFNPAIDLNQWRGITLYRVRLVKSPTMLRFAHFIFRAFFWLIKQKADLFIAYDYLPLLPLRLSAFFRKCIYVYDSVELLTGLNSLTDRPLRRRFWRFYERFGIQKVKAAFTVCESDAEELQRVYPQLSVQGFVRNIPVYRETPPSAFLREKYNIPPNRRVAIYQGMVFKGRGLERIIEACRDVPDVVIVIVGEGPLRPELEGMTKKFNMSERVIFTGLVPFQKLEDFTASADFGFTVISGKGLSYFHALPNKLFEYIQVGIPVIGSNYPEIARIIDSEKIGYTVNPESVQEIKDAVQKMLMPQNYRTFKERLKKIRAKYTWQEESEKYLKIIDSALRASDESG